EAKSRGVLPQSFNGSFAQSCGRIRGSIRQEEAVLAACGLHERRPNQVPRRWLDVSDTRTPAATETLIESQPPLIGMRTRNRRSLRRRSGATPLKMPVGLIPHRTPDSNSTDSSHFFKRER